MDHAVFDGLRVRPPENSFDFVASPLLGEGHPPFTSKGTIGEVVENPALGSHGQVEVKREILGVLERLEPIDDQRFLNPVVRDHLAVCQEAVAPGSSEVEEYGGM